MKKKTEINLQVFALCLIKKQYFFSSFLLFHFFFLVKAITYPTRIYIFRPYDALYLVNLCLLPWLSTNDNVEASTKGHTLLLLPTSIETFMLYQLSADVYLYAYVKVMYIVYTWTEDRALFEFYFYFRSFCQPAIRGQ